MIRRPASKSERRTPCVVCGFPRSHRHHRFPVSVYGEHEHTIQLCSNCHGIYHLLERHYIQKLLSAKRQIESHDFQSWAKKNGRIANTLLSLVYEDNRHREIYDSAGNEEARKQLFERIMDGEFDAVDIDDNEIDDEWVVEQDWDDEDEEDEEERLAEEAYDDEYRFFQSIQWGYEGDKEEETGA